jgi:hypothetical protein
MTKLRTYSELCRLRTYEERFEYLKLGGGVGRATFAFDRHLNQRFYTSSQWHRVRNEVIVRDNACDLGLPGYEILVKPLIHHINPMLPDDLIRGDDWVLNPEYLITTTYMTHNNIHFGVERGIPRVVTERKPGDTQLW